MNSRFRRRVVALAAAYAVGLQLLLSGLVQATPPAGAGWSAICAHDSSGGNGEAPQHEMPCAAMCAAMGHGLSGSLPPIVSVVTVGLMPFTVAIVFGDWVIPHFAPADIHAPRGPPLA